MDASGYLSRLKGWLAHPFKSDGNALDWFLFLGFAMVVAVFWTRVLKSITDGEIVS